MNDDARPNLRVDDALIAPLESGPFDDYRTAMQVESVIKSRRLSADSTSPRPVSAP